MKLSRLKFKLWMLEIPVWIVGLLWAMSAGADSLPSDRPLKKSSSVFTIPIGSRSPRGRCESQDAGGLRPPAAWL